MNRDVNLLEQHPIDIFEGNDDSSQQYGSSRKRRRDEEAQSKQQKRQRLNAYSLCTANSFCKCTKFHLSSVDVADFCVSDSNAFNKRYCKDRICIV